jgi:hypothetical protein
MLRRIANGREEAALLVFGALRYTPDGIVLRLDYQAAAPRYGASATQESNGPPVSPDRASLKEGPGCSI